MQTDLHALPEAADLDNSAKFDMRFPYALLIVRRSHAARQTPSAAKTQLIFVGASPLVPAYQPLPGAVFRRCARAENVSFHPPNSG
jgi:hypothetical protein